MDCCSSCTLPESYYWWPFCTRGQMAYGGSHFISKPSCVCWIDHTKTGYTYRCTLSVSIAFTLKTLLCLSNNLNINYRRIHYYRFNTSSNVEMEMAMLHNSSNFRVYTGLDVVNLNPRNLYNVRMVYNYVVHCICTIKSI